MSEEEYRIYRKVEPGHKYRVFKSEFNSKTYYKIQITQTNYDKSKSKYYQQVTFKRGVEIDNETDIIIKKAYENCRENPKDKYNPVFYLLIGDFEIVERQEQIEAKAYDEFRDNLNDIEINEDDLGF